MIVLYVLHTHTHTLTHSLTHSPLTHTHSLTLSHAHTHTHSHTLTAITENTNTTITTLTHKQDNLAYPPLVHNYTYSHALRDKVVKRLNVIHLIPQSIRFIKNQIPEIIKDISDLTDAQRRLINLNVECQRPFILYALNRLVKVREAVRFPVLMLITSPRVAALSEGQDLCIFYLIFIWLVGTTGRFLIL